MYQILADSEWRQRADRHQSRMQKWIDPHLERKSHGRKHPVYDFLFDYYSFRPSLLNQWVPGAGVVLDGEAAVERFGRINGFSSLPGNRVWVDPASFPEERIKGLAWVLDLLRTTFERAPVFGCRGLHEWAMVYRQSEAERRHAWLPLRVDEETLNRQVESGCLRCTHYDAFRFFTPPARAFNELQPRSDSRLETEQRGCIHVNMDLYKWGYKFYPWVGSDLIAKAFEVCVFAREVDMRASPYDVRELDMDPIPVETPDGARQLLEYQREIAVRADSVRAELIGDLERLYGAATVPVP